MASLDSELRDDSQSLESSQLLTPVDKTSSVSPKIISVICGSVSGELYLDKLSNRSSSKLGGIKCVLSDSSWYSLTEFKSLGGKAKSKNWRKSVTVADSNVQLGAFLQSIGSSGSETPASSPSHVGSPSARPKHSQSGSLIDPVLAYIKAYRLRGDSAGLKQSVCSSFDSSALSSAHRRLWDYCSKELEQLGLPYHARRGSDKRHLSDVLIADLLLAFDKLDLNDNLPPIYCEAVDLIMLPCLAVDPISERLEANTNCLHSVADKMNGLPPKVSDAVTSALSAPLTSCCDSLNSLVNNVASQVQQLVSCVDSLKGSFTSNANTNNSTGAVSPTPADASPSGSTQSRAISRSIHPSRSSNRSENLILFGLPEASLLATKSDLDDVSNHLIGRPVEVLDAFRLGRKPNLPNAAADPSTRPRPLLIKCASAWDRRLLLASRRKLKDFTKYKLFLREDLPPDERHSKRSPGHVGTVNNTHPLTVTSQVPSSDTTHTSEIPGADRVPVLPVHS